MGSFEYKKKFGQNFLTDNELLAEIVKKSGVMCDDVVVEIGAGRGALTKHLASAAKEVFAFEIDRELEAELRQNFDGTNVQLVFDDVMNYSKERLNKLTGGKFKLVANLPYYVTSPIITRFVKNENLESITVMVQEEVADRIVSKPKTKDYGVLTIICQLFGEPQKLIRVGREKFYPVPKVDSAVVRIDKGARYSVQDYDGFVSLVKRAFAMRRKKLSTNLETESVSKAQVESLLAGLGKGANTRAEELSVDEFIRLFELFKQNLQ